jgi:hypothetical protein
VSPALRILLLVLAGSAALAGFAATLRPEPGGRLTSADGDTVLVTDAAQRRALGFAPSVVAADRRWIRAAIARARPDAARLIAAVDGVVEIRAIPEDGATLGVTRGGEKGFTVDLVVARLNGDRAGDRDTVVLHELGHVIDFALVSAGVNAALDAQIPRGGPCGAAIDCDRPEERFADTFAKWALGGAVSAAGAGYGIPLPASLEAWGAPLSRLAYSLPRN